MREDQVGFFVYVVAVFMVVGVGIGGGLWYFFYREGVDPFAARSHESTTSGFIEASGTGEGAPVGRRKEDINDDGVINQTDVGIVKQNTGCAGGQPCWSRVVGKTLSGDNPIYASDLDMNGDDTISEEDANYVSSRIGTR